MMNCKQIIQAMGFSYREAGNNTLHVTTPIRFYDGEPIGFYLIQEGEEVTLTDDADTLFKFIKDGYAMEHRWNKINDIIYAHNLNNKNGEIHTKTKSELVWVSVGNFIDLAQSIAQYEAGMKPSDSTLLFVSQVEKELKSRGDIIKNPSVTGGSNKDYTFNFQQNGMYIDAITPHQNATGSELRKLIDVQLKYPSIEVLIVINDQKATLKKVEEEILILNNLASVTKFTDFVAIRH